ncbi:MAG: hypothetical protein F2813_00365 [Actinobacteria bacterium]|uniref:Unannotated protein n=1 Tax=freshwater metagenome TaxID=449393 RepID=A0A6J5Z240_9ZZZZ|nr:hypothetical protein [Actinomycetota bacterium]
MTDRFVYVAPSLPSIRFRNTAVSDLGDRIKALYPTSYYMGSMGELATECKLPINRHRADETIQRWLLDRWLDLPSIDHALVSSGYHNGVVPSTRLTDSAEAAVADKYGTAAEAASGLMAYILQRVYLCEVMATSMSLSLGEERQVLH